MATKLHSNPHMTGDLKAAVKPGPSHSKQARTGHGVTKQDEFPTSQRHTKEKKKEKRKGKEGRGRRRGATN